MPHVNRLTENCGYSGNVTATKNLNEVIQDRSQSCSTPLPRRKDEEQTMMTQPTYSGLSLPQNPRDSEILLDIRTST